VVGREQNEPLAVCYRRFLDVALVVKDGHACAGTDPDCVSVLVSFEVLLEEDSLNIWQASPPVAESATSYDRSEFGEGLGD